MLDRLEVAWARTDALFGLLGEDAWLARPIPLRHPPLFYLGHLPAFGWNQVCVELLGREPFAPHFDRFFAFGIDPLDGKQEARVRIDSWPDRDDVLAYRDRVRAEMRGARDAVLAIEGNPLAENGRVFHLVLEHELMHHETLLYILAELDPQHLVRREPVRLETGGPPEERERVEIPPGEVVLGANFDEIPFGWDNEFPQVTRRLERFWLERFPVTVNDWREFLDAGGYDDASLWSPKDWSWRVEQGIAHPNFWRAAADGWEHRHLFGWIPLDEVGGWPALVSHAEASAYARWRGARLPTEAELHRAAYGSPTGERRPFPWGEEPPATRRGNYDFKNLDPVPVGSRPEDASAFGVEELVGNGWEWTATDFAPLGDAGTWHDTYPDYSREFYGRGHKVLFGASWATDATLLRPTFRNWFQPRYPYVFATFRLAWDD